MREAQISESASLGSFERNSLSKNEPELGDCVGLSSRMEMLSGESDVLSLNT